MPRSEGTHPTKPRERGRVLEVRNLRVGFPTEDGLVQAVQDLSFDLERGETLGLVGESGSGKSASCLALLSLLGTDTAQVSGQALLGGQDLLRLPSQELRSLRGRRIAMIFQDPFASLHPMYRVGAQVSEAVRAHEDAGRAVHLPPRRSGARRGAARHRGDPTRKGSLPRLPPPVLGWNTPCRAHGRARPSGVHSRGGAALPPGGTPVDMEDGFAAP